MLPKNNRLSLTKKKDKDDYSTLLETPEVNVKYKKEKNKKAAVIVSKSVAKSAVDRNRIKRIFLESFKSKDLSGEFIFIVKKNIENKKSQELDEIFKKITARLDS